MKALSTNRFCVSVFLEAAQGRGEDAYKIVTINETTVLCVFDGLGGRALGYQDETGGRIASRIAAEITENFLQKNSGEFNQHSIKQLQNEICNKLQIEATKISSRLRGNLTEKRLCTTLAIASISQLKEKDHLYKLNFAWIGDSRIYFLSPNNGLQQLTKDDLQKDENAFDLIRKDSLISQYLTSDILPNWQIHFKSIELPETQGCIIACTDGCFQYLESPWHFEKLLLNFLEESNLISHWQDSLIKYYEEIKQDDISLILYPVGFSNNFSNLKHSYIQRLAYVRDLCQQNTSSDDHLKSIWNRYRHNYEALLNAEHIKIEIDPNQNKTRKPRIPDFKEADKLFKEKKWDHAIQLYSKIINLEPKNFAANYHIGIAYVQRGMQEEKASLYIANPNRYYYEAINAFSVAFSSESNEELDERGEGRRLFALALERVGQEEKAISEWKQLTYKYPNNAEPLERLGRIICSRVESQSEVPKSLDVLNEAFENLICSKQKYEKQKSKLKKEKKFKDVYQIQTKINDIQRVIRYFKLFSRHEKDKTTYLLLRWRRNLDILEKKIDKYPRFVILIKQLSLAIITFFISLIIYHPPLT